MEENGKYLGQAKQKINSKNYIHQNILKKQEYRSRKLRKEKMKKAQWLDRSADAD